MPSKRKFKILIIPLVLIGIYFITTLFLPALLDKKYNGTQSDLHEIEASKKAVSIYNNLEFIADLHSDALLWKRELSKRHDYGQVDIPRMKEAKVDLQVFTVVSKSPKGLNFEYNDIDDPDNITYLYIAQGRPIKSWFSLKERAITQSVALQEFAANQDNNFKIIRTIDDLIALEELNKKGANISAGLFGIEGSHVLQGDINNVQVMYDLGVRMASFVHFFDNKLGGSGQGVNKGGITEFGKEVLREYEKRSIIIDLAHTSDKLFFDLLKYAIKPMLMSHTGIIGKSNCNTSRNMSDKQIIALAEVEGIIGIAYLEELICGSEVSTIANQMKHVRDLVGVEHVALGSDSDGSIPTIIELREQPLLVDELLKLGFTEAEIKAVMGENIKRFLLKNLPSRE